MRRSISHNVLLVPHPGFSYVSLAHPEHGAFYPNVGTAGVQLLCLGARLPGGIPVTELVLLSYGLLSLQTVTLDARDPAGILNSDAADFWQRNLDAIPLTNEPFLADGREADAWR